MRYPLGLELTGENQKRAKRDIRVDAYIVRSADFTIPILNHLRECVHSACPSVVETIKGGCPYFDYKGMMCGMASFKQYCAFGFRKASLMKEKSLMENSKSETSMGDLGKITSLKDLPSDRKLIGYIKEVMKLNDDGTKVVKPKPTKKDIAMPDFLGKALSKNKKAKAAFENFSPYQQREYLEWLNEAKTEVTREKRLATTIEWLAEGKVRNWKYVK